MIATQAPLQVYGQFALLGHCFKADCNPKSADVAAVSGLLERTLDC
jgi:hypothetical protein